MSGNKTFVQLACGFDLTCGRTADGVVYCWGYDLNGELGNGGVSEDSQSPSLLDTSTISGNKAFGQLASGISGWYACALTAEHVAYCWGSDSNGQLGDGGSSLDTQSPSPVDVSGITAVPGPVLHLKFDESSGTTAFDSSGFGNNGNLMNGPTWTSGKIGNALSFDGTDDYVEIPGTALNIYNSITVSAWINPIVVNAEMEIVCKAAQTTYTGYEFGFNASGELRFRINPLSSTFANRLSSGAAITRNTWQHVAATYDGTTISFYKNGALINSVPALGNLYPTTENLVVGIYAYLNTYKFLGSMDDLRIYNRSLSASEIFQIYQFK
jgi:hypothetical protein